MLFSQATLFLAFASSMVSARPHYKRWGGDWTSTSWPGAKQNENSWPLSEVATVLDTCDLSKAQMPVAPTPLPAPAAGLTLFNVAIGRGTQNYTCDTSNPSSAPVAVGAVASLYNVSCLAAQSPDLLAALPAIALQLPAPGPQGLSFSTDLSGHHYFLDDTTPFFNLNTAAHEWGTGAFAKNAASAAPASAMKGQNGQGNGAVPWLRLTAKAGVDAAQKLQEVYRVNTQGGNPPATCAGQPAAFEIAYAAEYWIWE